MWAKATDTAGMSAQEQHGPDEEDAGGRASEAGPGRRRRPIPLAQAFVRAPGVPPPRLPFTRYEHLFAIPLNVVFPDLDPLRELMQVLAKLPRFPKFDFKIPDAWVPPNWDDLDWQDLDLVIELVSNEGLPLAWVPSPEIVSELAHAPDTSTRDAILIARRSDITHDCRKVLAEVSRAELAEMASAAAEAATAVERGLHRAAQALAANVFDTALRHIVRGGLLLPELTGKQFDYRTLKKKIAPHLISDDLEINRFRAASVLSPVVPALARFDPANSQDPAGVRFNRHATAHRVDTVQFTPENAIISLMLAVSLVREIQHSAW